MLLDNSEIKLFWKYLQATGYTFEVEEVQNGKYFKQMQVLGDILDKSNPNYYEIENKWGSEYRLYFYDFENLNENIKSKMVSSYKYGGEYGTRKGRFNFRVNDNELLSYMVENVGLRVGEFIP